ncbi:MAG: AAA family ATPase [Candidatus Methanoperedens sp.]|nr:MAG: AAA family ATPase [Candidatus Methanoperedens sp.]
MKSKFLMPGTIKTIPARATSKTRISARNRFTKFFLPASIIVESCDLLVSVACLAIPMAPDSKKEIISMIIRNVDIIRRAISGICFDAIEAMERKRASDPSAVLRSEMADPNISKNPIINIITTTMPDMIIRSTKGTHRFRFFIYVSIPLLMILFNSSAIFNLLNY